MIALETCIVIALAFAAFAAVTALGSSLVLGIGFERLRIGFETVKSQTGFFADAIHKLDGRMDSMEKQNKYFFESLNKLEEGQAAKPKPRKSKKAVVEDDAEIDLPDAALIRTEKPVEQQPRVAGFFPSDAEEIRFH